MFLRMIEAAFLMPDGRKDRIMTTRMNDLPDQLRQLIEAWRNYANDHYCETYNPGMAQGLRKAAKDLEKLLKEDECPAAHCRNCGMILRYGFCFNSSCEIDEKVG